MNLLHDDVRQFDVGSGMAAMQNSISNLQRDSKTSILCQHFVFVGDGTCFDVLFFQ